MLERIFSRKRLPVESRLFAVYYNLPEGLPEKEDRGGATERKIPREELKIPKSASEFLFFQAKRECEEAIVGVFVDVVTCINLSFDGRRVNYLYIEEEFVEIHEMVEEGKIKVLEDGFDKVGFDRFLTSIEEHLGIS